MSRTKELKNEIEKIDMAIKQSQVFIERQTSHRENKEKELAALESKPVEYKVWINMDGSFHQQCSPSGAYIGGYNDSREAVLIEKKPVVVTSENAKALIMKFEQGEYLATREWAMAVLQHYGIDAVKG